MHLLARRPSAALAAALLAAVSAAAPATAAPPAAAPPAAAAPAPAAAAVRTPDRARYTVALTSDATGATWTGTESVTFANTGTAPLPAVYLRLWDNYHGSCPGDQPVKVSNVTGGTAGALEVSCTALKVTLPAPLAAGAEATVGFDLSIAVPDGIDRFGRSGGYSYVGNALPVLAVNDEAGWHLDPYTNNGEAFYQLASDYRVSLDHPSTLAVPATGTSVDTPGAAGRTVTTATAVKVREFAWSSGPFTKTTTTSPDGITVNTYRTPRVDAGSAASVQSAAASAIDGHGRRFGTYPYGEIDVVLDSGFWFGGMEYPGLVFDQPSVSVVIHELAHQWFYGIVGNDEYRHPFLDEGFTSYATALQQGQTGAGCRIRWSGRAEKLSNGMDYWDQHPNRYSAIVYNGGTCTLQDLGRLLGADKMATLMRDYAQAHWYGISTVADFKAAAQTAAGSTDLTSFWASHRLEG